MTTQITPETDPSVPKVDANAELRAHADRALERAKAAEAELLKVRLGEIGLDPATGLGKAIAKEYEGEFTLEAIAGYAEEEYGHQSETGIPDTRVQQIEEAQARADRLSAPSESIVPATTEDETAAREARLTEEDSTPQDAAASVAHKMGRFVTENYGR